MSSTLSTKGFISRKLLMPREASNYAAVAEHESYETFWTMHTSPTQAMAAKRVMLLLDGEPRDVLRNGRRMINGRMFASLRIRPPV